MGERLCYCAIAFYDSAAKDWREDAVDDWFEDVHGEAERDIFNTDWCVERYDDPDNAGDKVMVWLWTDEAGLSSIR